VVCKLKISVNSVEDAEQSGSPSTSKTDDDDDDENVYRVK
jgi:hypothetical protein